MISHQISAVATTRGGDLFGLHQLLQVVSCLIVEVRKELTFIRIGRGHLEGPSPLLHGQIREAYHPMTGL